MDFGERMFTGAFVLLGLAFLVFIMVMIGWWILVLPVCAVLAYVLGTLVDMYKQCVRNKRYSDMGW